MIRTESARYRWVVLTVGTFAQGSAAATTLGMAVLAPAIRDKYGISLEETGVVLAGMSVGALLTLLPWGLLADRAGEGVVVALGLGLTAVALAGAALVSGFVALACFLLLAGIGVASVQTGTGRAVMGWFKFNERGFALGFRHTAVPVGGALAAVVLPWVSVSAGVRGALLVLAGGAAAAALLSLIALRQNPRSEPVSELASPLRNARIWRISWASALFVCVQTALLSFTVLFLHDRHGLSTAAAGGVLAAGEAVGAVLRLASGRWSDRRGDRVVPIRWLGLGVGVTVALAAAAANARVVFVVPIFIVACGLSMGWNALSFAAVAELGGAARSGAALGVQQTVLTIAVAATPLVFAPLVAATSWQLGFALLTVFPAAALYVLRGL